MAARARSQTYTVTNGKHVFDRMPAITLFKIIHSFHILSMDFICYYALRIMITQCATKRETGLLCKSHQIFKVNFSKFRRESGIGHRASNTTRIAEPNGLLITRGWFWCTVLPFHIFWCIVFYYEFPFNRIASQNVSLDLKKKAAGNE